jgi:predicted outer membrane protein
MKNIYGLLLSLIILNSCNNQSKINKNYWKNKLVLHKKVVELIENKKAIIDNDADLICLNEILKNRFDGFKNLGSS